MIVRSVFPFNCWIVKLGTWSGTMKNSIPYYASGTVVKGFGRGSKNLGTPTANFDQTIVDQLPKELPTGIYFGWAQINRGPVLPMVTSLGWNPYFGNKKKSMETHIMHEFTEDFYGSELKIILAGYLRDEMNFKSLDDLKAAIQKDVDDARLKLHDPEYRCFSKDSFFNPVVVESNKKESPAISKDVIPPPKP